MAITGVPTTPGNDIVTITPTGGFSVNRQGGIDPLVLNLASLGADITYSYIGSGYHRYSDDGRTTVDYTGFEKYNITMGAGDNRLVGGDLNDTLAGGQGNDLFESGLGAYMIGGGLGMDRWSVDYCTVAAAVELTLLANGVATDAGSGTVLVGIEAIRLTTGATRPI